METIPEQNPPQPSTRRKRIFLLLVLVAFLAVLTGFLAFTPEGLLGKADAIGYAVCHRIDIRSFHIGDRALPLCARCTGTFLGAFAGVVLFYAVGRGRRAAWPPTPIAICLAATIIPWGLDGLNSYLTFFPFLPHVYTPENWLRLTTGTLLGLAVATLFLPALNQSVWKNPDPTPILRNGWELIVYMMLAPALIALVLLEDPIVLFPLAIFSTLGVVFLLTGVYLAVLLMIFRQEGKADSWRDVWPFLVLALTAAFLQFGIIDIVRFAFTGTWGGFQIGGFGL